MNGTFSPGEISIQNDQNRLCGYIKFWLLLSIKMICISLQRSSEVSFFCLWKGTARIAIHKRSLPFKEINVCGHKPRRADQAHFPLGKTGRFPSSCCSKTKGAELSFCNVSIGFPLLNNSTGWPPACPFDLSAYSVQPSTIQDATEEVGTKAQSILKWQSSF